MVICSGNVIFEPETWKTGSRLNRLTTFSHLLASLTLRDVQSSTFRNVLFTDKNFNIKDWLYFYQMYNPI